MTLSDVLSGSAEGDALIQRAVVADLRRFSDNDPASVVDKQSLSYLRAGVDLNSGEEFRALAYHPRAEDVTVRMQYMRHAVCKHRMKPRIKQRNLKPACRRGVALLYRGKLFLNASVCPQSKYFRSVHMIFLRLMSGGISRPFLKL